MKHNFFGILTISFLIIVFLAWYFQDTRREETQELVNRISQEYLKSPEIFDQEIQDVYGNVLKLEHSVSEDCLCVKTTSAGLDKTLGNSDDIYCVKRDYNKSRIAGKWVVSRTKEFAKGVVSGFKTKSKFEDKDELCFCR